MPVLAEFVPLREEITLRDLPLLTVRGLSLDDFGFLLSVHLPDLNRLAEIYNGGDDFFAEVQRSGFILKLLHETPRLVTTVIARAADASEEQEAVMPRYPVGVQIKALEAVLRLTLEDVGGPKGLATILRQMGMNLAEK